MQATKKTKYSITHRLNKFKGFIEKGKKKPNVY